MLCRRDRSPCQCIRSAVVMVLLLGATDSHGPRLSWALTATPSPVLSCLAGESADPHAEDGRGLTPDHPWAQLRGKSRAQATILAVGALPRPAVGRAPIRIRQLEPLQAAAYRFLQARAPPLSELSDS